MEWLGENWIWVVLFGAMGAMHLFGHGKGGHGKGAGHGCCGGAGHGAADGGCGDKQAKPEKSQAG